MSDENNPMGREYTKAEIAAARRLGLVETKKLRGGGTCLTGPLIWATGDYYPSRARCIAQDWMIVSKAMDREWEKGS